jgi:hypothetical protein
MRDPCKYVKLYLWNKIVDFKFFSSFKDEKDRQKIQKSGPSRIPVLAVVYFNNFLHTSSWVSRFSICMLYRPADHSPVFMIFCE